MLHTNPAQIGQKPLIPPLDETERCFTCNYSAGYFCDNCGQCHSCCNCPPAPAPQKRTKRITMIAYVNNIDPPARGCTFVHSDGQYKTFRISRNRARMLARVLQFYALNNLNVDCNIVPHFDGWSAHINREVK